MGKNLRHVLVLLLIILKEPNMPQADCDCKPSSRCDKGQTSIPQNLPTSISELDLGSNNINTVKQSKLLRYKNLSKLCLERNLITKIEAGTFANLSKLKYLSIHANCIAEIESGSFANLRKLQTLYLKDNEIRTISSGTFGNLPQLRVLHLSFNKITKIDASAFANLPQLGDLCLSGNKITTIPSGTFRNLRQLHGLWLDRNQITTIRPDTLANLPQLQSLCLNNNQITTIHSGTFNPTRVSSLYLHNNQITTIHRGTFSNLPELRYLYLYNNQITTIHFGAFANLPELQELHLDNNQMSAIPQPVLCLFSSTKIIKLDGNPWQCDCRMVPVRLTAFKDEIMCTQPAKVEGQKLANVDLKELTCKDPTISPVTIDSCSTAVSTPSVGNTESNTSPSVFKTTAGSTANHKENTSKTRPTLASPLAITSEMPESAPSSPQLTTSKRIADMHLSPHNSHYHWYFKANSAPISDPDSTSSPAAKPRATLTSPLAITSEKPESSSFPIPVLIGSVCGSVAGNVLISVIIFTVWNKIKSRRPSSGLNPNVVGGNTNTAVTVSVSNDDHEDTDKLSVQNGQGQANIQSLNVGNLSHNQVLAALKPNPMYAGTGNAAVSVMASGDDHQYEDIDKPRVKTGQGQSQANTESKTTTKATVMASGDDRQYENVDNPSVKTGQGQSQANTHDQSLKVGNLSHNEVLAALQPNPMYVDVKTPPNNEAYTEIADSHANTGQGQSQAVTESLDARNLSYGTGQTASQQNPVYKAVTRSQTTANTATVMTSGDDQAGQGQSRAITESLDAKNLSYGTGPTDLKVNSVYTKLETP